MSNDWYCQLTGSVIGPYTQAELSQHIREGRIAPSTLVRQGASGAWVSASRVEGLFDDVSPTQVFTRGPARPGQQDAGIDETVAFERAVVPPAHHRPTGRDRRTAHHKPHAAPARVPNWVFGLLGAVFLVSVLVLIRIIVTARPSTTPPLAPAEQSPPPASSAATAALAQQVEEAVAQAARAREEAVSEMRSAARAIAAHQAWDDEEKETKRRLEVLRVQGKVYAARAELGHVSGDIKALLEDHPHDAQLKQLLRTLDDDRIRCENLAHQLFEVR